ncbi:MAG: CGNR zinc finger domain-containing protein [Hamadaea sp.]|nr:CGNR zinc finger domain-containing protein [Hamadaea sp.]
MTADELPARRPAPAGLRLVQDFCNSTDFEAGFDHIADADGLAAWLAAAGHPSPQPIRDADVQRAIRFREALRDFVTVPAQPDEADERAERGRAVLDAEAADLPLVVSVGATVEFRPASAGLTGALAAMLAALALGQGDGTARRLKACESHSCRWVFYDQSRNGSSRWCTMSLCGARSKNRAYRRRRRDAL